MRRWWRLRGTQTWFEDHLQLAYLIGGPDMRTTEHWAHGRRWVRYWTRIR